MADSDKDSERIKRLVEHYADQCKLGNTPNKQALLLANTDIADDLERELRQIDALLLAYESIESQSSPNGLSPELAATRPDEEVENHLNFPTKQIGPYKLLQLLGVGGMGEVWMAEQDKPVRRRVALKLIKQETNNREIIARFEAERQALSMMDHQNIARVLDAGTTSEGSPYFVMELVKGTHITKYCNDNKLSVDERLRLFVPICHAIQHAHQKGIIHRDLKPSNVLISLHDGKSVPKVIDFGLAKALDHTQKLTDKTLFTELGKIVGTVQYMSPEQAEMNQLDIDTRTDIYSLGVMLYELLTGSTPLEKETIGRNALLKTLEMIREREPPRPSDRLSDSGDSITGISDQRKIFPARLQQILRGELDWIVMKALEKDRTRRYGTADEFADDVTRYIQDEAVLARPASFSYRARKIIRKHKGLFAAAATIAILLVAGIASTARFAVGESRQRRIAEKKTTEAASEAENARMAEQTAKMYADQAKNEQRIAEESAKRSRDALKIFADSFRSVDPKRGANVGMLAKDVLSNAKKLLNQSELDDQGKVELLSALTTSFEAMGNYDDAIEAANTTVRILKENLGVAHDYTLAAMNNLASIYDSAARTDDAIRINQQVYAVLNAKKGLDHPDALSSLSNLALSYSRVGQIRKATELHEEVLRIRQKNLGEKNLDTLTSMHNLASCYAKNRDIAGAIELYDFVFKERKKLLGVDHPDTLKTMMNLAGNHSLAGRIDESIELGKEAIELMKIKLGEDHPDTLTASNNLADCYRKKGKYDESIVLNKKVLDFRRTNLGFDHRDTLISMGNLAVNYALIGRTNDAIELYERVLELKKKIFVANDVSIFRTKLELGKLLIKNDVDRAVDLLSQVYEHRKSSMPNDWLTYNAQSVLGGAMLSQDNLDQAKSHLIDAYTGLKRTASDIPKRVRLERLTQAIERLIGWAENTGNEQAMNKWSVEKERIEKEYSTNSVQQEELP
ncbi:MAG: serine/threonine-protein kinase [Planctomycetota bacterium]